MATTSCINDIDLKPISKLVKLNLTNSNIDLEFAENLYRTFLLLHKYYPNQKLVPSVEMDIFWHNHILHSRKYFEDCNNFFGCYLHHHPEISIKNKREHESHFANTMVLIKKHFNEICATKRIDVEKFNGCVCS